MASADQGKPGAQALGLAGGGETDPAAAAEDHDMLIGEHIFLRL